MKNIGVLYVLFLFLLCGCSDWLTVMPKTQMPADDMFKNEEGFQDALMGCYIKLADVYRAEGDHVSDFIEHIACQWDGFSKESMEGKLNVHEYFDADGDITRMFQNLYKSVADVNIVLEYIDNGVLQEAMYNELKGQLLALRAFLHFELIRLWGPIPTEMGSKKYLPYALKIQVKPYEYSSYDKYMSLLTADLDEAERLLMLHNNSTTTSTLHPEFLKYYGLLALRSRVALWMNDKEAACKYARMVCESGYFMLGTVADVNSGAYSFPTEHIFTLAQETKRTNFLVSYYVYEEILRSSLFADDPSDVRLSLWMQQEGSDEDDVVKMNCIKFNLIKEEGTENEDLSLVVPIIRLAELYLILIECSDIDTANRLYEEFCLARRCTYTPLDLMNRQSIVMMEYQKEFVGEGQLFYYYKRLGIKNMPRCSRACGTASYVLPLPRKEIDITY